MIFVFAGNRRFVLEEMIQSNLKITHLFIVKNSHLEKDYHSGIIKYHGNVTFIDNKVQLIALVESTKFDILISNGCPFIFPSHILKKGMFINIHPSLLPQLRGVDPVIGAILYQKDAGATCHLIDENIDTGPILSQVKIEMSPDLDVSILYQLSFIAEKRAFKEALLSNFEIKSIQNNVSDLINYKRSDNDRRINFESNNYSIKNQIKAFNNNSQGCYFKIDSLILKVFSMDILNNKFLHNYLLDFKEKKVALCFENFVIFKKDNEIIKFGDIDFPVQRESLVGKEVN
jgi:methionyl-tRNA formyltransferase